MDQKPEVVIKGRTQYPLDIQLYVLAPETTEKLENLEKLARDRIELLKGLEYASMKGLRLYSDDWLKEVLYNCKKSNLIQFYKLITSAGNGKSRLDFERRQMDHMSHFLLRLIYCDHSELRNWFIERELEFLKLRFINYNSETRKEFLKVYDFNFETVSNDEKNCLKDLIVDSTPDLTPTSFASTELYKIPFHLIPDLVEFRKVYLSNGFAYVPEDDLMSCILPQYKQFLKDDLPILSTVIPQDSINLVQRLRKLLPMTLNREYYLAENSSKEVIEIENIDVIARQSFPLCMRSLHEIFRTKHHLKHFSRLQYSFFLKSIGLKIEPLTKLWKDEFCKIIDENTFNKKYLYGIQHTYGLLGRRREARAYDCRQIIARTLSFDDCHGCPYKHWDATHLRDKLSQYNFPPGAIQEIVEEASNEHYYVACGKYFQVLHNNVEPENVIVHPNQYFDYSRKKSLTTTRIQQMLDHVGTGLVKASDCGDVMKLKIKVTAKLWTQNQNFRLWLSSLATEWIQGKSVKDPSKCMVGI